MDGGSTNNVKSQVTKGKKKNGSKIEQFDFELDKMTKKDRKNVLELIKSVRSQEDELTRQQAYCDSFEEELKKLKESSASLSSKCKEDITKAYACATKSNSNSLANQLGINLILAKQEKLASNSLANQLGKK
jgi:hypothetical protein